MCQSWHQVSARRASFRGTGSRQTFWWTRTSCWALFAAISFCLSQFPTPRDIWFRNWIWPANSTDQMNFSERRGKVGRVQCSNTPKYLGLPLRFWISLMQCFRGGSSNYTKPNTSSWTCIFCFRWKVSIFDRSWTLLPFCWRWFCFSIWLWCSYSFTLGWTKKKSP